MDGREETRSFELFGGSHAPFAARLAVESVGDRLDTAVRNDVRLLVSELVTNAVRHAGAGPADRLDLVISTSPGAVRVEVGDGGPGFVMADGGPGSHRPSPAARGADPPPGRGAPASGWGLFLVDELADRWGVVRSEGARVWFEIERG